MSESRSHAEVAQRGAAPDEPEGRRAGLSPVAVVGILVGGGLLLLVVGPMLLFAVMLSGVRSASTGMYPMPGLDTAAPSGASVGPSGTEYPGWVRVCAAARTVQQSWVELGVALDSDGAAVEDAVDAALQAQTDMASALAAAPRASFRDGLISQAEAVEPAGLKAAAAARLADSHAGDPALTAKAVDATRQAWSSSVDLAETVRAMVRGLPGSPACLASPDPGAWTGAGLR